jgi:hypothetical protein
MLVSGGDAMPLEIPAFAGMTKFGNWDRLARSLEIPAFAGMTNFGKLDRFKNNGLFGFSP